MPSLITSPRKASAYVPFSRSEVSVHCSHSVLDAAAASMQVTSMRVALAWLLRALARYCC